MFWCLELPPEVASSGFSEIHDFPYEFHLFLTSTRLHFLVALMVVLWIEQSPYASNQFLNHKLETHLITKYFASYNTTNAYLFYLIQQ